MEVLKVLCVGSSGSSQKELVINSFRNNAPTGKGTANTEPVKITAVVRGIPRQVLIHDYNSKLTDEQNYVNSDIVLIFANANLETESWAEAVQDGFSSKTRAYSWLEEVKLVLPHVPFMFVLTGVDSRPDKARRRDREWVTQRMLKDKGLRRGAIATVELPTNPDSLHGEIKPFEELFQLAVVKALEPGVLHIRGCSCGLCCGCRGCPLMCCIEHFGLSCAACFCPGYPGGYECLRCIPCCRTYTYQAGREISPSQLRRAKMAQEDSLALRKNPCAMFCPYCCCGEFTDYDVADEFGGRSAFF